MAAFIHDLRYRCRNVDFNGLLMARYRAPSRPLFLNGAVRTNSGFNSVEWPLYGVLSILILLTAAVSPPPLLIPLPFAPPRPTLEATWFAFKPPHSRARSHRDSSSRLLSFSDFPALLLRSISLACFLHRPRSGLVTAAPSISLRYPTLRPFLREKTCME